MKHASDRQLLDLLALGPPGEGELAGHLDCCAECRARLERFAETWEVLGHLEASPASVDLAERIVQAAAGEPAPASPAGLPGRLWAAAGPLGRVAAVVLAASAAGFALGRFTGTGQTRVGPAAQAVTQAEAANAVYLDQFCSPSVGIDHALSISYLEQQEEEGQ